MMESGDTNDANLNLLNETSENREYKIHKQTSLMARRRRTAKYITVEISSPLVSETKPLSLKSRIFHDTVLSKIQQLHGDFGVAAVRIGFLTKYCNENTRIAILRCRHGPHMFVTSSIPFVTKIGNLDVTLRTLHVGATLKHCFKFIQKHQRAYLDSKWMSLKSDEERKRLEAAVMDFTKTDVAVNIDTLT